MGIRSILAALMKRAEDDAYSLADKSGVPQPTTQRFLSGKHGDPRSETIQKWATAYGITESQLRGFTPIPDLDVDADETIIYGEASAPGRFAVIEAPRHTSRHEISVARADTITINVFDARASAGPGAVLADCDTVVGGITLTRAWISGNLRGISSPKNLAVLSAYGDSMTPTFNDGDLLLLDTGVNEVKVDAIFVFAFKDDMYVKRLQRKLDGTLLMISDNKSMEPQTIDRSASGFRVLGRVMWAWNGKKL